MPAAVVLRPPGDKSITHRALMLAALADGESHLAGPLTALDARSMATVLRALGVSISPLREGRPVTVAGRGLRGLRAPHQAIHCGNSGTTARFLLGVLSGCPFATRLTGDASLRRRPMRRVTDPLSLMGARFEELAGGDGLPIRVFGGPLRSLRYDLPVAAAQVKSALLLAGLTGGARVDIQEPGRSRDHTERMLRSLGVAVDHATGRIILTPSERLPAFAMTVPGDISSAAFLIAAALLGRVPAVTIQGVGVNPTRTGVVSVLRRMGGRVSVGESPPAEMGEPVADLTVRPSVLKGVTVGPEEVPSLIDEIPVLAILASRAEGASEFRGVRELRVKESDRLHLLAENLRAIGVVAEASEQTLWVEGTRRPPIGSVETAGDHRLAMAFAVLNVLPGARVSLSERRSVAVSYPRFFRDLAALETA